MPRKKKRPEEQEGKYKSYKTGKFVSAHYGKRNPKRAYKVEPPEEQPEPRVGFLSSSDPTLAKNFEERMSPGLRARQIKDGLKTEEKTFSDSADLLHWMDVGVSPEEAAEWVMGSHPDEDAAEFAERFLKRCEELRAEG